MTKNIIELLPVTVFVGNVMYQLNIYPNAWNNLTITYRNFQDRTDYICSVCVEPNHEPVKIDDTIGCMINERIGNARTFDDAAQMMLDYLQKTYPEKFIP